MKLVIEEVPILGVTKVSMNLNDEVLEALRELANRDGLTLTEVTRRAISTWKFLDDAQRSGRAVLLRDPQSGETERLIFR